MRERVTRQQSATRLSELALSAACRRRYLSSLARLSLVALISMLSGCIVEDPPALREATRTPPRLDNRGARPLLDQIIVARINDTIPFTIPVTSEDAGEGLTGVLLLDYLDDSSVPTVIAPYSNLAPSTLDDESERVFKFDWVVTRLVDPGCHRITLLAGHASTMFDLKNIVDREDLDVAYWWANIDVTPENANRLQGCPDASRPFVEQKP